jgi:hypothetical protein
VWIVSFIVAGVFAGLPALWNMLPTRLTLPVDLWVEARFDAIWKSFSKPNRSASSEFPVSATQ